MRIHTELLLTTLLFTLLPIESIQFYNGPNDIANPFGPNMEKYNSQAFNLIDLLNKVNANNSDSVKANQAGNQQLQNFQKDFRTYVKSKNNLFNYSNWSDRKPLANVVNLNSGQPDRSSSFNDRFSNIQRPNFDGDQEALQRINSFNNENHTFNENKFGAIRSGDQISSKNSLNATYKAILERVNKSKNITGDNTVVDCFNCTELRTESDCSGFESFKAKQFVSIFCCQCSQFSGILTTTAENYFQKSVDEINEETDSDWYTYLIIFSLLTLCIFFGFIVYWIYKCCRKLHENSNTQIDKLIVEDPSRTEQITNPEEMSNNSSNTELEKPEEQSSDHLNEVKTKHVENEPENLSNLDMVYQNSNSSKSLAKPQTMPQCSHCSSVSQSIDLNSCDSESRAATSSCSSCSALNNKNLKENFFLMRDEAKRHATQVSSQAEKPSYNRYCKPGLKRK